MHGVLESHNDENAKRKKHYLRNREKGRRERNVKHWSIKYMIGIKNLFKIRCYMMGSRK